MRKGLALLLLLWCATTVLAQPPQAPGLTVTGRGVAEVMPDQATVVFAVVAQDKQAAKAQARADGIMNEVTAAVTALGITTDALTTSGLSLLPLYQEAQPHPPGELRRPRIIGYQANNRLEVRVAPVSRIGPVIDAAVNAGVNGIESVTFGLKDDREARRAALSGAARDARLHADAIAAALGVRLLAVEEVNESDLVMPLMRGGVTSLATEATTPVQPGQLRVEASVTVRYRIEGASEGKK